MRRSLITALAAGALLAGAAVPAVAGPKDQSNIVQKAMDLNDSGPLAGQFDNLIGAVTALDLVDTLSGNRQFTVFAPTDDAFEAVFDTVGVDDLDGLVGALGIDTVRDIVLYHVAPGERFAADVADSTQIRTLLRPDGKKPAFAPVMVNGSDVYVDEGKVIAADVDVSNGVIHAVDAVLMP